MPARLNSTRAQARLAILCMVVVLISAPSYASSIKAENLQGFDQPNIILIVSDYMGYSDIEPYGSVDIKTPSLNVLALTGIKFTDHYTSAPKCIPARASLLSGLYPAKVLTRFDSGKQVGLAADRSVLAKALKKSGYSTAIIGKWHLGLKDRFKPSDHGFDYFFGFNAWALGYHDHLTADGQPGLFRNNEAVTEAGYLTELFTEEAVQFIDKNKAKPFFLYLSYNTGLPPYQGPDLAKSKWSSGWDANDASREDYVSMVEAMDHGIGQVLDTLKEQQLDNNTIVVFTYDHGGRHLVDAGPLFHGFSTLWEGGIRVPLIVRWPDQLPKAKVFSGVTISMDVTATLLEAAASRRDISDLDGSSLKSIIHMPKKYAGRNLYWKTGKMKAARQGRWKYLVDGNTQFLFDLSNDVGERKNLFSLYPDVVRRLKTAYEGWERSSR